MEEEYQVLGPEAKIDGLKDANGFYDKLREKITTWAEDKGGEVGERAVELLLLAPDFFILLLRLARDPQVAPSQKALLVGIIAYYILPIDIMPEVFLGPLGYMDDLVLGVLATNKLLQSNREAVLANWSGRQDLLEAIETVLAQAEKFLSTNVFEKVKKQFSRMSKN